MTDPQYHAIQIRGLRNARKAYRQLDTLGELVERQLDRLIGTKTKVRDKAYDELALRWQALRKQVDIAEKALADAIAAGRW